MARSKTGINGIFSGRIGNVVFYELNGQQVARQLPAAKMPAATGAKKQAQENFAKVNRIMSSIRPYVSTGFQDVGEGLTGFRKAVSVNLKRLAASPDPEGLQWLLPTMGTRAGANDTALQTNGQMVTVTWGAPHAARPWHGTDMVMLLAINTTTLESTHNTSAIRSQQQCTFQMPRAKEGQQVLVFLSFYDSLAGDRGKHPDNVSEAQGVL